MGRQLLNAYITFHGNCREAMSFYADVLGGTAQFSQFRDYGMDADGIMHASIEGAPHGFALFASDHVEGMGEYRPGTNVQLSLSGDEAAALRGHWDKLSDGGQIVMPLARQPWGDDYGQLVDKFGIVWHVNIAGDAA